MSERKSFLLRIDRDTLDAVQRWANDDLRSLNGQIEFILRRALQANARAPKGVSAHMEARSDSVAQGSAQSDTAQSDSAATHSTAPDPTASGHDTAE